MLGEKAHDRRDVARHGRVQREQVGDREIAQLGSVPPGHEKTGDAPRLPGIGQGEGNEPVERGQRAAAVGGNRCHNGTVSSKPGRAKGSWGKGAPSPTTGGGTTKSAASK